MALETIDVGSAANDGTGDTLRAAFQTFNTNVGLLISVLTGEGASLIGVQDSGTFYSGTDVEAVLAEIGTTLATDIPDEIDEVAVKVVTFVGNNGAGTCNVTSKVAGYTPAVGDRMVAILGWVTAAGTIVAVPTVGSEFTANLVDNAGSPAANQASVSDLSGNTYIALINDLT